MRIPTHPSKLFLTLSVLAALTLNVSAQYKTVTSGTVVESGSSYRNAINDAALRVSGVGTTYSGTGITLSATTYPTGGSGYFGAYVYSQARLLLTGGTITARDLGRGVCLVSDASGILTGVNIQTTGNDAVGAYVLNSRLTVNDGTITTTGSKSHGVYAYGSTLALNGGSIGTTGSGAYGVALLFAASGTLNDATVTTTGNNSHAVVADISSTADLTNFDVSTSGSASYGVSAAGNSVLVMTGGSINTTGASADAVRLYFSSGTLGYTTITTAGDFGYGVVVDNSTLTVTGGTVSTSGSIADGVYLLSASGTLDTVTIKTIGDDSRGVYVHSSTLAVTGGSIATGGSEAYGVGLDHSVFSGSGLAVNTAGEGSHGVYLRNSSSGTLNSLSIQTSGENAHGVYLENEVTGTDNLTVNGGEVTAEKGGGIVVNDLAGNSVYRITLTGGAQISGTAALNLAGDNPGTLVHVAADGASLLNGDVNVSGFAVGVVNLDNSTLTGKSTVSGSAALHLSLSNHANWNLTDKSQLTTLTTNNGSITIASVQGADLTVSNGINGQTALNLALSEGVKGQQEIHVVVDETNGMDNNAFTLGSEVSAGMYQYALDNRESGAWLVYTGTGGGPVLSSEADAVLNGAAAVSGFWFTQLDNLNKRLGELRYNTPHSSSAHPELVEGLVENVWVRSYGQQANINTSISGVKGFSETQYGVDLGTDKAWLIDDNNTLYTGIFAGYGGADRDFHSGYDGSTDSGYGGLYGTWIHKDGWYADAIAKGQYFNTSFDGTDHGAYDSVGVGLSLELGRQFQFQDGWFAEPGVQVGYLHLTNDNYRTTQGMNVDLNDADILQFYGGARLGRNIKLSDKGWLQPYVKVGGLEQISSGGQVRAEGGEWRPNVDGARGVIGAGVAWQLDESNQLHLDYEASFGDKYDKPWGLNFGYRHQF